MAPFYANPHHYINISAMGATPAEDSSSYELDRLRDEVDRIAHALSHDLRAPLRLVLGYCEELEKAPPITSDPVIHVTMKKLHAEAHNMKALADGILDYMRFETYMPEHSVQDGNELVAAAIEMLQNEIQATDAQIICDPLPQLLGHRGRLTRLFIYLIDNALKFRNKHSPPIIRVSVHQARGDKVILCVADNGIGMKEDSADVIFDLFKQLHSSEAYPGYGIGLALSRKIVESHGGKLWVESTLDKGSQFYFTLPAATV